MIQGSSNRAARNDAACATTRPAPSRGAATALRATTRPAPSRGAATALRATTRPAPAADAGRRRPSDARTSGSGVLDSSRALSLSLSLSLSRRFHLSRRPDIQPEAACADCSTPLVGRGGTLGLLLPRNSFIGVAKVFLSCFSFLRTIASCPMHVAVTSLLFSAADTTFSRVLFKILSQNLVAFCHGSAAAAAGVSLS
jgi:hypothetical protein